MCEQVFAVHTCDPRRQLTKAVHRHPPHRIGVRRQGDSYVVKMLFENPRKRLALLGALFETPDSVDVVVAGLLVKAQGAHELEFPFSPVDGVE